MNIVLVHLGDMFFDYINDCIEQIRKFNDCKIYLIISNQHNEKILDKSIIIENVENIQISEKHKSFNETTSLDRYSRGGFWKFATERFFYIEDLMLKYDLKNVFHIENDNLLYFDIISKLEIFEINYNIAAVFDNDNRCIPSFMYFKESKFISELTDYIKNSKFNNDMEVIATFNRLSDNIDNLPILPDFFNHELRASIGLTTNNSEKYKNNYIKFDSIYDAACFGQYIGGVDPLNIPGDTTVFINESCLFNVSLFKIEWIIDENNRKIPYAILEDKKIKINNLHIHSKNLKKFM